MFRLVSFQLMRNNIRGELTVGHTREQFSLKDNSFIAAVASSLQISCSKVTVYTYCPSMCNFSLQYPYTAKLACDDNQENDQWQDIALIWNTRVFERVPLSRAQISLFLKVNVLGRLAVGDLCSRLLMHQKNKLLNGWIINERRCQLNLHLDL